MSKWCTLLLVIAGMGLLGAQGVRVVDTHTVTSETLMAPGIIPTIGNVQIAYSARIMREGDKEGRLVGVKLTKEGGPIVNLSGSPEDIEKLADTIETCPAAYDRAPKSTTIGGRVFPLRTLITDMFPSLGIFTSSYGDGFSITAQAFGSGGLLAFDRKDAKPLADDLRDAAAIARHLP